MPPVPKPTPDPPAPAKPALVQPVAKPPAAAPVGTAYEVFLVVPSEDGATETLVPHGEWNARTAEDAIWQVVEGIDALKTAALSGKPPVLRAASAGKGGLSPAKPYALAQTIKRVT